ncbi:MAG: hypothetical protein ACFCD0_14990 [Gemmataceae bacterium]
MALFTIARTWREELDKRSVRQFVYAIACAWAAIAIGCLIYLLEKYLLQPPRRFMESPAAVTMRACGLAHFIIGWLFLFTSSRVRNPRAAMRLGWLTLIGIGLCFFVYFLGASSNPFVIILFYGYFLVHELRDQSNIYQRYGDAPGDGEKTKTFLPALRWATITFLVAILAIGQVIHGMCIKHKEILYTIPSHWYMIGSLGIALLCALALVNVRRAAIQTYGSVDQALLKHKPLATIYGIIFLTLSFGMIVGSTAFNLIILVHAGAWLVFVSYQLANETRPERFTLWTWLRRTPTGFIVLHISIVGIVLSLMALRVYVWDRVGILSQLVEGSNFIYWSLLHISMAFWKAPR